MGKTTVENIRDPKPSQAERQEYIERLEAALKMIQTVMEEQRMDKALWADTCYLFEGYLQEALIRLHLTIERELEGMIMNMPHGSERTH